MFKKFLKKIRAKKLFFVIPFLLGISFVLIYTFLRQPLYQMKTTVKAENAFDLTPTSNEVMSRALANLGTLDTNHPDISMAAVKGRISINKDPSSGIVEIIIRGTNTEELSKLTREITNTYVAKVNAKSEQWKKTIIEKKEQEMQDYKKNLKEQLSKAKEQLEKYEQQIEELKKQESGVVERASDLRDKLAELEKVRAGLSKLYTPAYPEVVRVDSEIAAIKEKLNALPKEPEGKLRLEREFKENQNIYNALKEKWDEANLKEIEEFKDIKGGATIISYTERPLLVTDISRRKSIIFFGSLFAFLIGLVILAIAVILDTTLATQEELFAFTHLYVVGAIPYVKAHKGIDRNKVALLLECEKEEKMIEYYKLVYMHIQANIFNGQAGVKTIFLTSTARYEGKSIIASNLALVMARAGKKVLIIDANLAHPAMHLLFRISARMPGFTDVLNKSISAEEVMHDVTDFLLGGVGIKTALKFKGLDRLKIITVGSPISDATELLRSERMRTLMKELKSQFDYIILDGPSVLNNSDSIIIATECDATLLVYAAGKTSRSSLRTALMRLHYGKKQATEVRVPLKGVILNKCI